MSQEEKDSIKEFKQKQWSEEVIDQNDSKSRYMVSSQDNGVNQPSVTDKMIAEMQTEYDEYHKKSEFIDPHTGHVYPLLNDKTKKHFAPYKVKKEPGENGKYRAVWYATGEVCGN